MTIDHDDDLRGLRRAGAAVAEARDAMLAAAPGVMTRDLDAVGDEVLRRHGARSAPRLAAGFPATTCVSVNDEAAHGHGTGRSLWEWPSVPSVEAPGDHTMLWEGLVLAIEPFLATGATFAVEADDGWTLRTPDGSLAAQFEHTVVVTRGEPLVMTAPAAERRGGGTDG